METFVGKADLFRLGQQASNALSCPGKIPPLAPYGGHSGTRVGSFKTVTFRLGWVEHHEQQAFETLQREIAA